MFPSTDPMQPRAVSPAAVKLQEAVAEACAKYLEDDGLGEVAKSIRAVIELYRPGLLHTQIACNEGLSEGSDDFDILPNPAVHDVSIRFRKLRNTITRYEIYNSTGQLVCSKALSAEQEFTISVDLLPRGIYAIKIQNQSHILIKI
jgi:hypothetical protein